ncbi:ATP-binding protein [Azospirillum sp. ST 5-10]|uniref:ATP-binding response regulator n=1 Tax=unclassified Azospirillum TaxID=2630922 RepID=UPI003F4A0DA6
MNPFDDPVKDADLLRRRLRDLDGNLEQALVAAEDAREEARRFAEERDRLADALASRDRAVRELQERLGRAEALAVRGQVAQDDLRAGRTNEGVLAEELQATVEELQVLAAELEEANADLEERVATRTAELTDANAALRVTEERLRVAQRCAGAGTWDWDLAADTVAWSPECRALLGLDRLAGDTGPDRWAALLHPDDRAAVEAAAAAVRALAGDEVRMEFRIRHPAAGLRWIAAVGRVVERVDGRPRRLLGMCIDVTGTKALEDELRSAKLAAERANDAKSRFLAAASHDLRQPIQAAALYTEVLRRQLDAEPAREVLDLLRASIDGLNGMLNGLLDLSRLEAGVIEPAIVDFVPDELMTRLASEFRAEAEVTGVELRCIPGTVAVATDPHLLERVLRNLVSNAIKHGGRDEGGRVLLACRHTGDRVEFQVWDNGPGIAPEDRERIFEEFEQLRNPERNPVHGFGLGLAIVARIARLLDLSVEVRSDPGNGSVFSVAVPVSTAAATQAIYRNAPAAEEMARLEGRTVLLIEDDRTVRNALTMLLREWGLEVAAAGDVEELAAVMDSLAARPDVVIADHRLPAGATARTAIETVRRRWDVPAIIVTGDTAPERLREAMAIGCPLLHKPIEPTDLACALRDAVAA